MCKFNLQKLSKLEVGKEYQIKTSNRSAALENFNDSKDRNRDWENINENIRTSDKEILGLYELKQHKPRFNEECLRFLDERKQAKMHRLQDPTQSNVDNLNNVRRDNSRHFRNKRKEYLRANIDELETNSKIKISETCLGSSII